MRLLDTDVAIDLFRGYRPALLWLASLMDDVALCGVSALELLEGCANAQEVRRTLVQLKSFPIYWPSPQDGELAIATYAARRLSYGIGFTDVLIGECAVGLDVPLATFTVRHFRVVPHLVTEQPYERV